jgi:hypothetical protein
MLHHIKKYAQHPFIPFILLLFWYWTPVQAQNAVNMPYSGFGVGDLLSPAMSRNLLMGGVGIATTDPYSINRLNPASIADIWRFTAEIGGYYQTMNQRTNSISDRGNAGGLQGLALVLKKNKPFAISLGFSPYSQVSYRFTRIGNIDYDTTSSEYFSSRTGDGGINEAFVGSAYKFLKGRLNVGFNASFLFGSMNSLWVTQYPNQFAINIRDNNSVRGFKFQVGGIYRDSLNFLSKKWMGSVGFVADYNPIMNLNNTSTITTIDDKPLLGPTSEVDTIRSGRNQNHTLPPNFGLGLCAVYDDKLTIAVDYRFQDWTNFEFNRGQAQLGSSSTMAFGVEFLPARTDYKNYLNRVAYRAGVRYQTNYLTLLGQSIDQFAVSGGFGLPISTRNPSKLSIGIEYSSRGTTAANLIQESTVRYFLGLSFIEPWTSPAKYD